MQHPNEHRDAPARRKELIAQMLCSYPNLGYAHLGSNSADTVERQLNRLLVAGCGHSTVAPVGRSPTTRRGRLRIAIAVRGER
jgi:hypothetical protein